jgi:hypothetical protein
MLLGTVVQVALDASPLGVPGSDDAGTRGLQLIGLMAHLVEGGLEGGVEAHVAAGQLFALLLDEPSLEEVCSDTTLDHVPRQHADRDGGDEEEVVVDQDLVGVLFTQIATTS